MLLLLWVKSMKKLRFEKKQMPFIIVAVLVLSLVVFLLVQSFSKSNNGSVIRPDIELTDTVKIDLVEYNVYQLPELDFRFVIVKLRIQSEEPIHLTLDLFSTSENILLSDTDSYLVTMQEKSLYVGRKQVDFEITSDEKEVIVNLFIPVKNKNTNELSLFLPIEENNTIVLDLSNHLSSNSDEFFYRADDVISDGAQYSIIVNSAIEITGEALYRNGTIEEYPSTAQLHAFYIDVTALNNETIVIEAAKYVVAGSNNEFVALDSSYSTEKRGGIIEKNIASEETGYLFFMTLNPEHLPISYEGDLYIKLKGIDYWIRIKVEL